MIQGEIIHSLAKQAMQGHSLYNAEPFLLSVEKAEKQVNKPAILTELSTIREANYTETTAKLALNNDVLILTSEDVDIPITATLTIESHNNLFKVTRAEYLAMSLNRHQTFERYLKISIKNYGQFIPFHLEFLKLTPKT